MSNISVDIIILNFSFQFMRDRRIPPRGSSDPRPICQTNKVWYGEASLI
jgi:hypothetical protein